MAEIDFAQYLKVHSHFDVLQKAVQHFVQAGRTREALTRIKFYMNGFELVGSPLMIEKINTDTSIILLGEAKATVDSLITLALKDVVALEFLQAAQGAVFLSANASWTHLKGEAPSRLSLERQLSTLGEDFKIPAVSINWQNRQDEDSCRLAVGKALQEFPELFKGLQSDALGKQAFLSIKEVQLKVTKEGPLSVQKTDHCVRVEVGPAMSFENLKSDLKSAFEKVL